MKNNRTIKILFTVVFLTITIFINATVVNAASKVGTCVYTLSSYTTERKGKLEDIVLTVTMGNNGKFRTPKGIMHSNGLYASVPNEDSTGFLAYVNGQFFCPTKVYIEKCTNSTIGEIKFITKQEVDDTFKCSNPMELKLDKSKVDGTVEVYTPKEKSNGELISCEKDPKVVVNETNALENLKNKIESTNDKTLLTYSEQLKKYDANKYCLDAEKTLLSNKISEITKTLNKKISKLELTNEEKKQLEDDVKETENKNDDAKKEVKEFEPKEFTCTELDPTLVKVIQKVLLWIRIAVPILLIILVSIDFAQAIVSQDQDAIKKAISKTIKRVIAALAVFFVPFIISLMLGWLNRPNVITEENKDSLPEDMFCEEVK